MKDKRNQIIQIGDEVVYAPAGSYAGISIGEVTKFTPKRVCIKSKEGGIGRFLISGDYYAYPADILALNQ